MRLMIQYNDSQKNSNILEALPLTFTKPAQMSVDI